jgi:hypothetical protein
VDEAEITTAKSSKIVVKRGKKQLETIISAERDFYQQQ